MSNHIYESGFRAGQHRDDAALVREERMRFRYRDREAWDAGYRAGADSVLPPTPRSAFDIAK